MRPLNQLVRRRRDRTRHNTPPSPQFWLPAGRLRRYVEEHFGDQPTAAAQLLSVSVMLGIGLVACSSDRNVTAPGPTITREALVQALTPVLAASVQSDGKLQLAGVPNTGRPQISAVQAGALAVALAKFNLPFDNALFDSQHGGPIEYQRLTVCGPTPYAAAAFQRLSMDDPASPALPMQKALGPFWLVTLCGPAGDPQLNVAVSAYSTDLSVNSSGQVVFPAIGGNDFLPEGIPAGQPSDLLPSPEAAVVLAAKLSGRRVAALPELIAPFYQLDSPLGARWHLHLDGAAHMQTADGRAIDVLDMYVSRKPENGNPGSMTWTADANQPADVQVTLIPQPRVGESEQEFLKRQQTETQIITVPRLPDVPIDFTSGAVSPSAAGGAKP
jgi:hypothetical protein